MVGGMDLLAGANIEHLALLRERFKKNKHKKKLTNVREAII